MMLNLPVPAGRIFIPANLQISYEYYKLEALIKKDNKNFYSLTRLRLLKSNSWWTRTAGGRGRPPAAARLVGELQLPGISAVVINPGA